MKRTIRLNESQLRRIVSESVKRILKEADVVAGTNTMKTTVYNTDNKGRRNNMLANFSSWENQTAPDYVQMWADRLEKALNKNGNMFEVTGYVDNDAEVDNRKSDQFQIVKFSVEPIGDWKYSDSKYLEKLKNFTINTIKKTFGNLMRYDTITSLSASDVVFPIIFAVSFEDETFIKHNPPRPIPRGRSTYDADDFGFVDQYEL